MEKKKESVISHQEDKKKFFENVHQSNYFLKLRKFQYTSRNSTTPENMNNSQLLSPIN